MRTAIFLIAQLSLSGALTLASDAGARLSVPRNVDTIAQSHLSLRRLERADKSHHSTWLRLASHLSSRAVTNSTKWTNITFLDNFNYVATVNVGGDDLDIILDTGSSDTWVVRENLVCTDEFGRRAPADYCGFGPAFKGTFQPVPNVARFSIRYGDGTSVSGRVGYQNVTIAGLTVTDQQMAFIEQASWMGDGVTSGVLGLSYPITSRMFSSTDQTMMYPGSPTHRKYDPLFTTMYKRNLTAPMFSLAMNKTSQSGWLAFGGLPPVDYNPDFASTPIRIVEADGATALSKELSYYTIVPEMFIYGAANTSNMTYDNPQWTAKSYEDVKPYQFPALIDSGATFSFLPEEVVKGFALSFPRPVVHDSVRYWAQCDAKVPRFGIVIGGKTFWWKDEDLLIQDFRAQFRLSSGPPVELCALGLLDVFPDGPFVLGDNFLNGLVSVFDVGATEMRFYERA